jgi:hypothetical protein
MAQVLRGVLKVTPKMTGAISRFWGCSHLEVGGGNSQWPATFSQDVAVGLTRAVASGFYVFWQSQALYSNLCAAGLVERAQAHPKFSYIIQSTWYVPILLHNEISRQL